MTKIVKYVYPATMTELQSLKTIISTIQKRIAKYPEGSLVQRTIEGKSRFYIKQKGLEQYANKSNEKTVEVLAQKEYDTRVLKEATKQLGVINRYNKNHDRQCIRNIYNMMGPDKAGLIVPFDVPDYVYEQNWKTAKFKTNPYPFSGNEIITQHGDRVRSKAELIIADLLNGMNLPYRYECALQLPDGCTVYPDFTILNVKTRNEIILEYFGMMDNPEYRLKAFEKIENYIGFGLFPSKRLITVFEDSNKHISINQIRRMVISALNCDCNG